MASSWMGLFSAAKSRSFAKIIHSRTCTKDKLCIRGTLGARGRSKPHSSEKPGATTTRDSAALTVFARARLSISGNPAQTIILKCDCNPEHTPQVPASDGIPPILYSMACHRCSSSLVTGRSASCSRPVDRPTDDRGAHPAPLAGLDSPHAVSRTLQIHSAQPNLARSPARCDRRRGRALLPPPWIRLARDPNRCPRRFGRRSHSRSFHHYPATGKKPILRNWPFNPPQGR